jgi:hypothetical protein
MQDLTLFGVQGLVLFEPIVINSSYEKSESIDYRGL